MNLEEMRARVGEIVAKLGEFSGIDLTDEQVNEANALNDEFATLKSKIEVQEKIANVQAMASSSTRQVEPKAPVVTVENKHKKTGGFQSYGEFALAVKNDAFGNHDKRFQNATVFEQVGEDGGILVPKDFLTEVKEKFNSQESLLALTDSTPVSGNSISFAVDEEQPWNGGVQAYWTGEGQVRQTSKEKLSEADYKLQGLSAMVKVNNELLEDTIAVEGRLRRKAPAAMMSKVNSALISGDGVKKPTGILNSGFKFITSKESGQVADTIVYKNIANMVAREIPGGNYVWLAHVATKAQLKCLKDDAGNFIYMNGGGFPNASGGGFDLLDGKPVMYMLGALPTLGDEGDLILVDWSYYMTIVKSGGVQEAISTHLYFDRAQTAFRFDMRLDGHCPYKAPVKSEFGDYEVSGIITLEDR